MIKTDKRQRDSYLLKFMEAAVRTSSVESLGRIKICRDLPEDVPDLLWAHIAERVGCGDPSLVEVVVNRHSDPPQHLVSLAQKMRNVSRQ